MGHYDPDQEERTGYSDECKKEIARLFWPWLGQGPDGTHVDKEAKAQSEKETDDFDHEQDTTQSPPICQPSCVRRYIRIIYLTVQRLSITIHYDFEAGKWS